MVLTRRRKSCLRIQEEPLSLTQVMPIIAANKKKRRLLQEESRKQDLNRFTPISDVEDESPGENSLFQDNLLSSSEETSIPIESPHVILEPAKLNYISDESEESQTQHSASQPEALLAEAGEESNEYNIKLITSLLYNKIMHPRPQDSEEMYSVLLNSYVFELLAPGASVPSSDPLGVSEGSSKKTSVYSSCNKMSSLTKFLVATIIIGAQACAAFDCCFRLLLPFECLGGCFRVVQEELLRHYLIEMLLQRLGRDFFSDSEDLSHERRKHESRQAGRKKKASADKWRELSDWIKSFLHQHEARPGLSSQKLKERISLLNEDFQQLLNRCKELEEVYCQAELRLATNKKTLCSARRGLEDLGDLEEEISGFTARRQRHEAFLEKVQRQIYAYADAYPLELFSPWALKWCRQILVTLSSVESGSLVLSEATHRDKENTQHVGQGEREGCPKVFSDDEKKQKKAARKAALAFNGSRSSPSASTTQGQAKSGRPDPDASGSISGASTGSNFSGASRSSFSRSHPSSGNSRSLLKTPGERQYALMKKFHGEVRISQTEHFFSEESSIESNTPFHVVKDELSDSVSIDSDVLFNSGGFSDSPSSCPSGASQHSSGVPRWAPQKATNNNKSSYSLSDREEELERMSGHTNHETTPELSRPLDSQEDLRFYSQRVLPSEDESPPQSQLDFFLTAPDQFLTAPDQFLTAPDQFLTAPDQEVSHISNSQRIKDDCEDLAFFSLNPPAPPAPPPLSLQQVDSDPPSPVTIKRKQRERPREPEVLISSQQLSQPSNLGHLPAGLASILERKREELLLEQRIHQLEYELGQEESDFTQDEEIHEEEAAQQRKRRYAPSPDLTLSPLSLSPDKERLGTDPLLSAGFFSPFSQLQKQSVLSQPPLLTLTQDEAQEPQGFVQTLKKSILKYFSP